MTCNNSPAYYGPIVPDTSVRYTGEGCESLGICPGDKLDEVLDILISELCSPEEQVLNVSSDCVNLGDKKLKTVIQAILNRICEGSDITNIYTYIDGKVALNLNGKCITLPVNPTINSVFQAIIDYVCGLQTGTVVTTSTILTTVFSAIESCQSSLITKTGSGNNQKLTITGRVPIGTYLFGDYNLSHFENTGVGKAGTDMCNAVLADGRNNTWDMRGMGPVGATNYGSGALNSLVDPVTNNDPDYSLNVGQVKGKVKVANIANNNAAHTHDIPTKRVQAGVGECTVTVFDNTCSFQTYTNTTNSSGTGLPVENRQPSRGGIWIKIVS